MILGVRACMLTIRHYVTNTTDSQNDGALGPEDAGIGLVPASAANAVVGAEPAGI